MCVCVELYCGIEIHYRSHVCFSHSTENYKDDGDQCESWYLFLRGCLTHFLHLVAGTGDIGASAVVHLYVGGQVLLKVHLKYDKQQMDAMPCSFNSVLDAIALEPLTIPMHERTLSSYCGIVIHIYGMQSTLHRSHRPSHTYTPHIHPPSPAYSV